MLVGMLRRRHRQGAHWHRCRRLVRPFLSRLRTGSMLIPPWCANTSTSDLYLLCVARVCFKRALRSVEHEDQKLVERRVKAIVEYRLADFLLLVPLSFKDGILFPKLSGAVTQPLLSSHIDSPSV